MSTPFTPLKSYVNPNTPIGLSPEEKLEKWKHNRTVMIKKRRPQGETVNSILKSFSIHNRNTGGKRKPRKTGTRRTRRTRHSRK